MRIPGPVYKLLNQRKYSWIIILIATVAKSILTGIFSNYEGDKSFFLLLAEQLGSGHGLTIPVTLLNNPALTDHVYIPSAVSPLYSLIAVPLLKIFPGNYFLVTWLIESVSWFLLFIVLHRIILLLTKEYFWANVFIVFSGFFLYNVELSSSSKDVLATAFIFFSLLRCLLIIEKKETLPVFSLVLTSVIFMLPGLTKYIYTPLTIVFPFTILFVYFISREKHLLRAGIITAVASIIFLGTHYFYFHSLEVNAFREHSNFYLNRWSLAKSGDDFITGFYPENLLLLYPYLPAGIFNLDVGGIWVRAFLPSMYRIYGILLSVINVVGILVMGLGFLYLSRKYFRKKVSTRLAFFLSGTIISFSMLLLASALSLKYHTIEYKGSISSWTYVFENRPFIFSIIFLQLILVVFIFSKKQVPGFLSFLGKLATLLMALSFIHGVYYLVKTSLSPASAKPESLSINELVLRDEDSLKVKYPGYHTWIATELQHLDWYAKLHGRIILNNLTYLNDSSFSLPARTILISVIPKEDTGKIKTYLERKQIDSAWNYDQTWFLYLQKQD